MTKADFASNVAEGSAPFNEISFEGFRPTFEAIQEALHELAEGESGSA